MILEGQGVKCMMKRFLAIFLSLVMLLSVFTACGTNGANKTETTAVTEPEEEAKVMKVLTLGSSSSVDSNHMINLVANAEGFDGELVIGTLYYSGCKLSQHVRFLTENSNVYSLYLSSTENPNTQPNVIEGVTMRDALRQDYWDVVVLQAGVFECMDEDAYTNGNIQTIRQYVKENTLNPLMVFGWHTVGVSSTDPDLIATYKLTPNSYEKYAIEYNYDRVRMFKERVDLMERYIMSDDSYVYVIASCTAMENAITSYLGQKGIKRDYTHTTDMGRLIAAYVWYAKLAGIEQLEEIKLDVIPKSFLKTTENRMQDRVLTQLEKAVILEVVNNTLVNPLEITPSQYTEAHAQ